MYSVYVQAAAINCYPVFVSLFASTSGLFALIAHTSTSIQIANAELFYSLVSQAFFSLKEVGGP